MPALVTTSATGLTIDASGIPLPPRYYGNKRMAMPVDASFGTSSLPWDDAHEQGDDLSSARGLVFGSMLGAVMWLPVIAYFCS
jgi:hypothetical protein